MRYIKILLIVGLMALLTNCEDYLDLAPELGLTEDVVFDNYESTRGYLDRCFPLLNDHTHWNRQRAQRAHPASLADEAAPYLCAQLHEEHHEYRRLVPPVQLP